MTSVKIAHKQKAIPYSGGRYAIHDVLVIPRRYINTVGFIY